MADITTSAADRKEKEYFTDVPQTSPGFFLKGSHQYDWGLKNRLSKVFNPKDGRTVMLAFDHGYFQGPTTGLERVDQTILPLEPYADCLMLTRGIQRSIVPASTSCHSSRRVCRYQKIALWCFDKVNSPSLVSSKMAALVSCRTLRASTPSSIE